MTALPGFADALLDARVAAPAQLRAGGGADPARRFDVHRNNVMSSLVRALEDSFPVCLQLVGSGFFRAMAREYVRAHPPGSPVLLEYGAGFADFVESFEPAREVPYLGDVARLERARIEAFNAADADVLAPAQFAPWLEAPERLMLCRVALHPSVRVLSGSRAVLALWQAHQPSGHAGLADAVAAARGEAREDLLVLRPGLQVVARVVPAAVTAMLTALGSHATLGEALEHAAACRGFDLDAAIALLVRDGVTVARQS